MQAELVNEHPRVYRIQVPFANVITTETNCYVMVDGEDALVIDAGAPASGSAALLSAALREVGVDPASARYFLTHAHFDHAGLLPQIAGPAATVYVNAHELPAIRRASARRARSTRAAASRRKACRAPSRARTTAW